MDCTGFGTMIVASGSARRLTLTLWFALCTSCAPTDHTHEWAQVPHSTAGGLEIGVLPSPSTPTQGDNRVTVLVRTRDGQWLRGAQVRWLASMPAMGAMPYMEARAEAGESAPGAYTLKYSLSMGGEWNVDLRIRPSNGHEVETRWKLRVGTPGILRVDGDGDAAADRQQGATVESGSAHEQMTDSPMPSGGVVHLDPARWSALGIRLAAVTSGSVSEDIEVAGTVAFDESRLTEVATRFGGRVRELSADHAGSVVRQGDPLCTVSSPELVDPELEFIAAAQAVRSKKEPAAAQEAAAALRTARRRLVALDVPEVVIDSVQSNSKPISDITILAPATGVVAEKSVSRGSLFNAGQMLFRIAPLDLVWIVASVPERASSQVELGAAARIEWPGTRSPRTGFVTSVAPNVDAETRTTQIRISCPNADEQLRPGMNVRVRFPRAIRSGVVVPTSAVFQGPGGPSVYVAHRNGDFELRDVSLGVQARDRTAVLSGLAPAETVVVQGQFLISAEQQTRQGMRAD